MAYAVLFLLFFVVFAVAFAAAVPPSPLSRNAPPSGTEFFLYSTGRTGGGIPAALESPRGRSCAIDGVAPDFAEKIAFDTKPFRYFQDEKFRLFSLWNARSRYELAVVPCADMVSLK
ncbi:MAG: hypothetical protein LBL51_01640 [Synergistaceae bacterium]|nr:hypothetical protein [Synergistaceae bacterium]